jgi:branched-chain amino acid transport system permease protein
MEQILVFSLLISALYALVAAGFTLIFGVARVFNLAHGAFLMVGAYAAYTASDLWGWDIYLATSFSLMFTAAFAGATYIVLIRPLLAQPAVVLMATLALSLLLELSIAVIPEFGTHSRSLEPFIDGTLTILGVNFPPDRLLGFGASWLCLLGLGLLFRCTRVGKAILATSQERQGALLMGIDVGRIYLVTFMLSGALAALAGIFFVGWGSLVPWLWREPLIISFSIVILGGLGSVLGSLVAAYLIGFLETLTTYTPALGPSWVGMPSLILLLAVLMLRPRGLFGRRVE